MNYIPQGNYVPIGPNSFIPTGPKPPIDLSRPKESFQPYFVLILLFVILLVIALVFIFRNSIFRKGDALGSKTVEELSVMGYGIYSPAYESACFTSGGKCTSAGIKYITEVCIPSKTTGNGCIADDGTLTFASRSRQVSCHPNCRSYILKETTATGNFICQYDSPYSQDQYNCIPPNAKSYIYRTFACEKNDSTGDNRCTYTCGTAGYDSAGLAGDADPTKQSYIPTCATNPGTTITLNSLPWNSIYTLPSNGVNISKGYNIKNVYNADGTVNTAKFTITPAYPPWDPLKSNTILYADLEALDKGLTTYNNCIIDSKNIKPICDNYFWYQPDGIESGYTANPNPSICTLNNTFAPVKECYWHPWYEPTGYDGKTGLKFVNPYTDLGTKSAEGISGETGYSWIGIGNYGYIFTELSCLTAKQANTPLTPDPLDPTRYKYPVGQTGGAICLNLQSNPVQCASSLQYMFSTTAQQSTAALLKQYAADPTFSPPTVTQYPQASGTTNYICSNQYPDGKLNLDSTGNPIPGCIQSCSYYPNKSIINFSRTDDNGYPCPVPFRDLLGKFVTFNYTTPDGSKDYFLGVKNTPCGTTGFYTDEPLLNCFGTAPYQPVNATFIYNGGNGIAAGNYWSKNNCDSESIELASNIRFVISPRRVYLDSDGLPTSNPKIYCDLFGWVNGVFGYFGSNITQELSTLFSNSQPNIIANGSGNMIFYGLGFGVLPPTGLLDNLSPQFILEYDNVTGSYNLYNSTYIFAPLKVDSYDGLNYSTNAINFTFKSYKANGYAYFSTLDFNPTIVKTSGLYAGKDVTQSINMQRQDACYSQKQCETANVEVCYPSTCNLYYEYTIETCR